MPKHFLSLMHYCLALIFLFITNQTGAQSSDYQAEDGQNQQIVLPVRQICAGKPWPQIVWIHVHDDEQTARQVAIQTLDNLEQGCLVDLPHGGQREISIKNINVSYHFDPNRIFTISGRKKALKCQQGDCNLAMDQLTQAVQQLLNRYLHQAKLIVAIHNNHANGLSVLHYRPTATKANDVRQIAINPDQNPHDFFFVTTQQAFDFLSQRGFNVVWQDNEKVEDDGSLSVWSAQHKIDYINIEAGVGHTSVQTTMLAAVLNYMHTYYLH